MSVLFICQGNNIFGSSDKGGITCRLDSLGAFAHESGWWNLVQNVRLVEGWASWNEVSRISSRVHEGTIGCDPVYFLHPGVSIDCRECQQPDGYESCWQRESGSHGDLRSFGRCNDQNWLAGEVKLFDSIE